MAVQPRGVATGEPTLLIVLCGSELTGRQSTGPAGRRSTPGGSRLVMEHQGRPRERITMESGAGRTVPHRVSIVRPRSQTGTQHGTSNDPQSPGRGTVCCPRGLRLCLRAAPADFGGGRDISRSRLRAPIEVGPEGKAGVPAAGQEVHRHHERSRPLQFLRRSTTSRVRSGTSRRSTSSRRDGR